VYVSLRKCACMSVYVYVCIHDLPCVCVRAYLNICTNVKQYWPKHGVLVNVRGILSACVRVHTSFSVRLHVLEHICAHA